MSKALRALQARKAQHLKDARAITDLAAKEGRDLTDDEKAQFEAHAASIEAVNAAITREQTLIAEEAQMGIEVPASATIVVEDNREADPRRGFRSFGEFAQAVRAAANQGHRSLDERLRIGAVAPTTFGNEAAGDDGGFLVPPDFAREIWRLSDMLSEGALVPLTDNTEIGGNSMVFPKDETTPWGTDGIRAYWQAEASLANQTKPKFGASIMRLYKLMALVPVTDELLDDASALTSYLPTKTADSIRWKTNEAILFGTGAGQPQGAFAGNVTVTVAKETGQATLTLLPANLFKMIARLPPGSMSRAVWLMGPDTLPALFGLTLGSYPIYLPAGASTGGMQPSPYGMLLGRPIVISQHAAAFSAQGDVLLADLKFYRTITKVGGVQTATSMHLYFDADAAAFRTTYRIDGQPSIATPIAQAKGTNTLSPFVQLAAR